MWARTNNNSIKTKLIYLLEWCINYSVKFYISFKSDSLDYESTGSRISSFENGTSLFNVLFVGDVGLPVRSHELHCLLSLETVEHVLAHQRILSVSVHLISEAKFLLLVDLSLHVVVLDLVKQCCPCVIHVNFSVNVLILGSRCILDWEWVEVGGSSSVNVWMELVSLTTSAASILHLDEVQRTANWCVHVLEFPLSVFLLPLGNLFLPDLPIIHLGILLGLGTHLKVLSVMLNLGVEFSFFDMSLILKLTNLLE